MRRSAKKWLFATSLLLLVGLILFGGAMTAMGWDFSKLSMGKYETNRHEIEQTVRDVAVTTGTADVRILPAEDGKVTVVCHERERVVHKVEVRDGVLSVTVEDTRRWYEHIGFFPGTSSVTVYLPAGEYGAASLRTSTGNVEVAEDFTFQSIDAQATTGHITCRASATGKIVLGATTGDLSAKALCAESMELSVSTGNIRLENVTCEGALSFRVSTGQATLAGVRAAILTSTGTTGNAILSDVIVTGEMRIERSTGNVRFTDCDAATLHIETETGDVTGSLLSPKIFLAHSDTGRVTVPETETGGICRIHTDTGDVRITV